MKSTIYLLLLLLPLAATAQNTQGMNPENMQQMMEQMQKMQTCMAGIDMSEMQVFEQRAQKLEAEVKALCASGKRNQAMAKAVAFGQEMVKTPAMQQMKKCGQMMQGHMPFMGVAEEGSTPAGHVCDQW